MSVFYVAIGGALGAVLRYQTYLWLKGQFPQQVFPFATLLINVVGCFVMGGIMVCLEKEMPHHQPLKMLAVMGFLSSYTTFSTFGFESWNLMRNEQFLWAFINILASVLLGLGALCLGRILFSIE